MVRLEQMRRRLAVLEGKLHAATRIPAWVALHRDGERAAIHLHELVLAAEAGTLEATPDDGEPLSPHAEALLAMLTEGGAYAR